MEEKSSQSTADHDSSQEARRKKISITLSERQYRQIRSVAERCGYESASQYCAVAALDEHRCSPAIKAQLLDALAAIKEGRTEEAERILVSLPFIR